MASVRLRPWRNIALGAASATAALGVAGAANASYAWPVRPFASQHLVSGQFGDPRAPTFHHGIDIRAPDGTPVYATLSGTVGAVPNYPDALRIVRGATAFEYWHIVPAVAPGTPAVAYRTLLGHIAAGAGHVHFSERRGGRYINPLREGALAPYDDATTPSVREIAVKRGTRRVSALHVSGRVSVIADILDWPSLPVAVPEDLTHLRTGPALVRWRLLRGGRAIRPWRAVADFRRWLPPNELFRQTYAHGSQRNWRNHSGRYRFYILRDFDTHALRNGRYRLAIAVADIRGNSATAVLSLRIAN